MTARVGPSCARRPFPRNVPAIGAGVSIAVVSMTALVCFQGTTHAVGPSGSVRPGAPVGWPRARSAPGEIMHAGVWPERDGPVDDDPDDRLSAEDRRLVRALTERHMPELVAALLAKHPTMHRVYIARAFARAALDTADPVLRERFFKAAGKAYRKVIALEDNPQWLRGLRRHYDIAQWRVEWADLILRHWIAPDLDRYEITSGLDYDRPRLAARLLKAYEEYSDAAFLLDLLRDGIEADEELFLLLGIGDKIDRLHEHRELNSAWAGVYLAMIGDVDARRRQDLLDTALGAFDAVARTTTKSDRKYNALLGAGVALRQSGRYAEAEAAFDRVRDSTAPMALTARARYEKARSLMRSGRFDAARMELDRLAALSPAQLPEDAMGALFYIRLAPLIRAYTHVQEANSGRGGPRRAKQSQEKAVSALTALSEQGGIWPDVVRVYLDALAGTERPLDKLTPPELRVAANRFMAEKDYPQAIEALRVLLDRADAKASHVEARFNLGVCLFQTQRLRPAAETFLSVARDAAAEDFSEKAAEYAYRCWRQIAHASKEAKDHLRLAEAAELIVEKFPDHGRAAEARWVGAMARQEARDYRAALAAYAEVPSDSPHHWPARRNIARCKQRLYEGLPAGASPARRALAAQTAAAAWTRLAEDLAALDLPASADPANPAAVPGIRSASDRDRWITHARLSAAAILADEGVRAYRKSLSVLADMPPTARVLALRIRCFRGLGDLESSRRVLADYLKQAHGDELGAVLIDLASEMEADIHRLREAGRRRDAVRAADDSLPTIRQLLAWIQSQPAHKQYAPVVRFTLAKTLIQARRRGEAMTELERLMADDPGNGSYLRTAALLREDLASGRDASSAGGPDRPAALDQAEALWAKLLRDPTLRDRAPAEYWQARYHWLKHQLRHGHAAAVIKGIETEKVWYPDLGGPPWQTRLLDLLTRARAAEANGNG